MPEGHYVLSIGVLHHTPDPCCSFKQLVPYLKSNGQISIWVYPPEMKKIDMIVQPTLVFPGIKHAHLLKTKFVGLNVHQIKKADLMPRKTKVGRS